MENTAAVNLLYVESNHHCQKDECGKDCVIMDALTGNRFCVDHAPRLWLEKAARNDWRIDAETKSIPSPCVVW